MGIPQHPVEWKDDRRVLTVAILENEGLIGQMAIKKLWRKITRQRRREADEVFSKRPIDEADLHSVAGSAEDLASTPPANRPTPIEEGA